MAEGGAFARKTGNAPPSLEGELEQLVGACLEQYFAEGEPALERVCRAHPQQADAIRAWVQSLFDMGLMHSEHFGAYRLVELLGEGGMGTVYLAEQREPVRRRVALKVIKLGMDTKRVLQRFDAERRALALMNHDNIAKVYDVGSTPRGQPYFVMEHVAGKPITDYCDEHRLGARERVQLVQRVCAGIQHAHQKGVIHRDLKPANILVVRALESGAGPEGLGVPKIIDFGLARAIEPRALDAEPGSANAPALVTAHDHIVGTPAYMSPEQAESGSLDIDTRADIYSLGVILYELLVGELPIPSDEFARASPAEVRRAIRFGEPPRPSRRITAQGPQSADAARARSTTRHALARELRGDLDWIVMRAMEKERERRYATAGELAADLQRYLDHEPVAAGPPGLAYRLRKFVRRHRLRVAAAAAVLATLVGGLLVSLVFWADARQAHGRAETALAEFDLLANEFKLPLARAAERELYPAWPARVAAMDAWLSEHGRPLAAEIPKLEAALHALQERAGEAALHERRAFLEAALVELLEDLRAFERDTLGGVLERRAWALEVRRVSIDAFAERWERACAAIRASDGEAASRHYAGFELRPQLGLVPLGPDPITGFWEFYHLRSGTLELPPERNADGDLPEMEEGTGIVFVLLPGGTFLMGAQRESPAAPNYDADSKHDDHYPHEVTLEPLFLAKHELSCAQWRAMTGAPAATYYTPGSFVGPAGPRQQILWTNPVETVRWVDCHERLGQHGLLLPTEAQWEYAARGGSDAAWWSGPDPRSLDGGVNLLDLTAQRADTTWEEVTEWLEDGFIVHAPVMSLRPNGFGLHHTLGNVWEWCRDSLEDYGVAPRPGDGLRGQADTDRRIIRGGSYLDSPRLARCAGRGFERPNEASFQIGVRPARAVRDD